MTFIVQGRDSSEEAKGKLRACGGSSWADCEWVSTKSEVKHVLGDGFNGHAPTSNRWSHMCRFAFCKLGTAYVQAAPQQVYRPQTTPVWWGVCSQSVTGRQKSVSGTTALPGKTQETVLRFSFIAIIRRENHVCTLLNIGVKLFIEWVVLYSVHCSESNILYYFSQRPWKGSFKQRNSALYTPHGVTPCISWETVHLFLLLLHGENVMTCSFIDCFVRLNCYVFFCLEVLEALNFMKENTF